METADIVVIGGAVIGASVAWHLKVARRFRGRVVVVERDSAYARASTALAASGIRHQFSSETNIRISQYGTEFIREFRGPDGEGLSFRENGYLILASDAAGAEALTRNHLLQRACGADVALLSPAEVAARFPHLNVEDLTLGSLGLSGEGWFDNMALLRGLRTASQAAGAVWLRDEAVGFAMRDGRVMAVKLGSGGEIGCDHVVNAAGTRAALVAAWAGIPLAVEPRKRTVFHFTCQTPPAGALPLMIDASRLWCRPEGEGFIAGIGPDPDPAVAHDDFEPRYAEFEEVVWPLLANRSPAFDAIRLTGVWAGHYSWNTLDQNAVLGAHASCPNLIFANGFSGHGLQQAPAVGRGMAELILDGGYRTLDLSDLSVMRMGQGRPNTEAGIY
ncbi:FAD-binding oxidoreductase [Limibaculum sp. M0105]|uniref:FAD-binding oxidoreductase n=1 Tax=Thermohalobaculum xanthum TaxID=2753746 RepID=A0A8J7SH06_9RHOB|nr:FAD-binding oxidoreductase [Thermohalobaculum xanthum]MBK0401326.1 FAD-binding oxidoreductase [Thermohalobaculum xanthum]